MRKETQRIRTARAADPVEAIFRALSDPTRRLVIERLGRSQVVSASKLAEPFDIALPSFTQHLDVLENAGLIRSSKRGRTRYYRLVVSRLKIGERWMARHRETYERLVYPRGSPSN